jgi:hypothetical protein
MRFTITAMDPGAVPGISTIYGDDLESTGPKETSFTQKDHLCKGSKTQMQTQILQTTMVLTAQL